MHNLPTLSRQERVFLEEIRQNRQCDEPRLIYADWLEEEGRNERAELIRLECEIVRLPKQSNEFYDLQKRISRLSSHLNSELYQPLKKIAGVRAWQTTRGFVESATYNPKSGDGFANVQTLLTHFPTINTVRLINLASRFADFRACHAWVKHLDCLDISRNLLGAYRVRELAACDGLSKIKELNLRLNDAGPTGTSAIFHSPQLECLEHIELNSSDLFLDGTIAVTGPLWKRLRSILVSVESPGSTANGHLIVEAVRRMCGFQDLKQIRVQIQGTNSSLREGLNQIGDSRLQTEFYW